MGGKSGKKRQEVARWMAKAATLGRGAADVHGIARVAAGGCGRRSCRVYEVVKVLAMRGGIAEMELNYHEIERPSR